MIEKGNNDNSAFLRKNEEKCERLEGKFFVRSSLRRMFAVHLKYNDNKLNTCAWFRHRDGKIMREKIVMKSKLWKN